MKISKITAARLYNLGNYEHVRYELTVEVPPGESAAVAINGMENILAGLRPLKSQPIESMAELQRRSDEIMAMKAMSPEAWEAEYGYLSGTQSEVIAKRESSLIEDMTKLDRAKARASDARRLFDDLGGAARVTNFKQDWDLGD